MRYFTAPERSSSGKRDAENQDPFTTNRFTAVYGLQITSNSAAAAAVSVQATGGEQEAYGFVGAGSSMVFPSQGSHPYFVTNRSEGIQVIFPAATNVCVGVQWRYEDNPQ
jgi:hypothetical protein